MFDGSFLDNQSIKQICNFLLDECHNSISHLYLRSHVKLIGYDENNTEKKNTITFLRKKTGNKVREVKKSYDYVILTFPLVKNIQKQQNFTLEILYRDFLDCELNTALVYVIDGRLKDNSYIRNMIKNLDNISLHTNDCRFQFQSIRSLKLSKDSHTQSFYLINSFKDLNRETFDSIFDPDYKIIAKKKINLGPVNKKVRYSHTAFPQIILDGKRRSRVFYLNSLEWLDCSKEMNILSARNIAFLIGKKELGNQIVKENNLKINGSNHLLNRSISIVALVGGISFIILFRKILYLIF